jgi:hypothetical protein
MNRKADLVDKLISEECAHHLSTANEPDIFAGLLPDSAEPIADWTSNENCSVISAGVDELGENVVPYRWREGTAGRALRPITATSAVRKNFDIP